MACLILFWFSRNIRWPGWLKLLEPKEKEKEVQKREDFWCRAWRRNEGQSIVCTCILVKLSIVFMAVMAFHIERCFDHESVILQWPWIALKNKLMSEPTHQTLCVWTLICSALTEIVMHGLILNKLQISKRSWRSKRSPQRHKRRMI